MTTEVKRLEDRTKRAQDSMNKSLGADLRESRKRKMDPTNPNAADAEVIFQRCIELLIDNAIDEFNNIGDDAATKAAVDEISKAASELKREAARVDQIADSITQWTARIDKSHAVITALQGLA